MWRVLNHAFRLRRSSLTPQDCVHFRVTLTPTINQTVRRGVKPL